MIEQTSAIDYILLNTDPLTVLNYYKFRSITEHDDCFRACCEIHKGDNPSAFVWKKSNNLWYCYTNECGGGDIFNLIQKIEGCDFKTAVHKAAEILNINIDEMSINISESALLKEQREWLNKQQKLLSKNENKPYEIPHTRYYQHHQNFTRFEDEILIHYGAKFCNLFPTEGWVYKHKLMIPINFNNVCVGVALRDTTGTSLPKWIYQPDGLKTKSILYNFDDAMNNINDNKLILVEGIFDVWAYHRIGIDNVVAIFGSSVKHEQYKMLLKTGCDIICSFDNDVAGNKCTKDVIKKFKNKATLELITLPEGKDPAECSENELMSAYLNRNII